MTANGVGTCGADDNQAQAGHLIVTALTTRSGATFDDQQIGQLVVGVLGDQSHTLTGGKPGQGYPAVTDGVVVRRLTPLECERLQGLPDGWTAIEGASDSQRYRQLGNSVAVPVFKWVLDRLAAADAASLDGAA